MDGFREHESDYLGKADRRWYIHVNPDDIRRVFFRRPDTRSWHSLYWRSASAFDQPMNEDGAAYARRLAKAGGTSTEPDAALEAMLEQWNLGLGRTAAERRLRLSRERATLTGELTTADESDAKAFIAAQRAASSASAIPRPRLATPADTDDDLDAYNVDDDDDDDDEYYADAFEDA